MLSTFAVYEASMQAIDLYDQRSLAQMLYLVEGLFREGFLTTYALEKIQEEVKDKAAD